MSHHGSEPPFDRKPLSEAMKNLLGEFPEGKLNAADEGAVAMMIGVDQGNVVMQFPKPVAWIGFSPEQAVQLAQSLIENARKAGFKSAFTIRV